MRLLAALLGACISAVWGSAVPRADEVHTSGVLDLGTEYVTFKSDIMDDTSLRFVRNSGVCETTPGVEQLSGYVDVGTNMSMVCAPLK